MKHRYSRNFSKINGIGIYLLILLLTLCIFLPLDAVSAEEKIYKSATEYDYPPFSVTGSGEADGFSVELLREVMKVMGMQVTFKIDQWSTIKEELKNGELDVLPLVGYTEERDEFYDFTVPYIIMRGNIFIRKDNTTIKTEQDLKGMEILVMEGDNAHEYALRMNFTDKLITTQTYEEAFRLLESGKYDAVLAQSLVGQQLINDLKLKNIKAATTIDEDGVTEIKTNLSGFEQKFCFAVHEGDKELLSKLNEGLAIVSANGTFNDLYTKWFPFLINDRPSFGEVLASVSIILVPVILIIFFGFFIYSRKQIKIKTEELERSHKSMLSMEARLQVQQRLESIGTLASGVAHEINNPINGIMNYGQLILDSADIDEENSEYANEIILESQRIAEIVRNLLFFSRSEKQNHSPADIKSIINRTLSLVNTIIRHDQIDLQIEIPDDLPVLKCRSQQIQQVIMNLITNSRDALNDKYSGYHEDKIIKLTCSQFNFENRRWIRITVEDHGAGIPEKIRDEVFEPFFTSKSRDKGTGLGLYVSYGIVKDHHGRLTFDTEEGMFTRFYVDLPVDNGWDLEQNSL